MVDVMHAMVLDRELLSDGEVIHVARARAKVHVRLDYDHDPRAMNRMDADTKLIHARLTEWAQFVKRWAGAQGYPRESYYHKWALLKIAPHPGHDPEIPERAARVDGAVARLGVIDKSVIVRFYIEWRPLGIWKGLAGVKSKGNFDIVLKRARWRVDGYLSAVENV